MTQTHSFRADVDLSALARAVLSEAGFTLDVVSVNAGEIILAENAYFIIAVAATPTLEDLLVAESVVDVILRDRIDAADVGPKVWDAYLVLLTQERPSEQGEGLRPLFSINYDTRGIRRMARAGVDATMRGVRSALAPFVEPVRLEDAAITDDPYQALRGALVAHGVDSEFAARVIELYQQGGRMDDVL